MKAALLQALQFPSSQQTAHEGLGCLRLAGGLLDWLFLPFPPTGVPATVVASCQLRSFFITSFSPLGMAPPDWQARGSDPRLGSEFQAVVQNKQDLERSGWALFPSPSALQWKHFESSACSR